MNILDMMNKLTALSQPVTEAKKPSEGNAFDLKTKTTPEKEKPKSYVHKGKYGMEYQGDPEDEKLDDNGKKKKKVAPAADEKRGRGRPKKGADNAGNVAKPDWSAFGAKKDVKLPKYDKKKTTKHSLKDWIENLDAALNESEQVTIAPAQQNTQVIKQGDKTLGTVTNPQLAQQIKQSIGKGEMTMAGNELGEDKNHMGETEYHGYYSWRVACRKAGAVEFVGDRDIDEGHDASGQAVGEWDGVVGSVYGDAHKANPAQDPYDQDDPAPMEECDMPPRASLASPMSEAKKKAKPDFLDKDKDGNKKEPFKKAVKDAKNPADSKSVTEGKLEELSKDTLKSYSKKSQRDRDNIDDTPAYGDEKKEKARLLKNRDTGMAKAKSKMSEGKVKELDMDLKDPTMKDAEFKKKYGKTKADMKQSLKPEANKPTSKIKESILRESHETLQHIINKYKNEAKRFVAGEDLDQDLYDALYDYYCDQGEMPYGTMKARDGDPYEWVTQRFDQDVQDHDVPVEEGAYSQDYFTANKPSPVRQAAQVQTKPAQTPFSRDPIAAVTDRVVDKFTAPKFGDVQFESWSKDLDSLLNEGMNVVANTGLGDGPDSVTISATDEDAQKLLAIVKSAGLGMFAGDDQGQEGSPQMSTQPQTGPEADIDVVDDHDGMLSLIRKMSGQGAAQPQGSAEVEVDEEETPDQREFQVAEETPNQEESSEEEVQQATDKLEKVHNAWSEGEPKGGEDLSHEDTKDMSQDEVDHALDKDLEGDEESAEGEEESAEDDEKEEEAVEESFANDADDTFESDIDFMQKVISGGVNKPKQTGQTTIPVVASQTSRLGNPMRESTDLLKDFRKLSGIV